MKLRPFQRAFIRGATAPGIDTAALSTPRGQGKSWLAAYLLARVACTFGFNPTICLPAGHGVGSLCRDFGAGQWIVFRFLRATLRPGTESVLCAGTLEQASGSFFASCGQR